MSFPKQMIMATVVVAAAVSGLVYLGNSGAPREGASSALVDGSAMAPLLPEGMKNGHVGSVAPEEKIPGASDAGGFIVDATSARALVPSTAWLVADFQGSLAGQSPFADQPGECQKIPPPERVAVAVLPPKGGKSPELFIAAPQVSDAFWACVVARVEQAGGASLAQNEQYQVFKSPSGIVARGPGGATVFLSNEAYLEVALAVISDLAPGASSKGSHAALFQRMHPAGEKRGELDITLALPAQWLSSVGRDALKSPLRHIKAAFLSSRQDGSAAGGVDCEEAGCEEVLRFLERAKTDLVKSLPVFTQDVINTSLKAKHLTGTGRIAIEWSPSKMPLGKLLGSFLGLGSTQARP